MKINEVKEIVSNNLLNKKLSILDENENNKGRFGHKLEKFLNLKLGSHHLDCEDGDVKTATIKNNLLKDDFKIAKSFDENYLIKKMNMVVIIRDIDDVIIDVQAINILEHPIYRKYFFTELEKIKSIGLDDISQSDTTIFVAKTNCSGKKEKSDRSLYISRAFINHILGYGFGNAKKGKEIINEIIEYEERNSV